MIKLWFACAVDILVLTLEAHRGVALRMAAMASGGANVQREAHRMVTEKILAGCEHGQ